LRQLAKFAYSKAAWRHAAQVQSAIVATGPKTYRSPPSAQPLRAVVVYAPNLALVLNFPRTI
jgi:hypothetical protein